MTNFTNQDDVIDSRDIISRIEELEVVKADFIDACDNSLRDVQELSWDNSDDARELDILLRIHSDGEDYSSDWKYGETLIAESYFNEYMDEMLEDMGELPESLPSYITFTVDYDMLKMDYTEVDFDGSVYYIRSC